jgi:hypothetical protein
MKPSMREVTRADGSTYEIETRNIGRPAPEFIDNDATWHEPDAYRAPGEETAHPEYRQTERDPKFAFDAFPPEHALPAGRIRYLLNSLWKEMTLSPDEVLAASPWTDLSQLYNEATYVSDWLRRLSQKLPEEEDET